MTDEERKFWIDCLSEKHECWTYEDFRTSIPLKVGRRKVQLHLPSDLDKVEILFTAERKGILFIIARNLSEWAQEMWCDGVLMVAKRLENGDYAVAIWHELYSYALNHLGLR